MEKREPPCTVGGNANWHNHYRKQYGDSFKNQEQNLPYDPATPLLGTYPEKTVSERDSCTPVLWHYLQYLGHGST